jgi:hypothetical protein
MYFLLQKKTILGHKKSFYDRKNSFIAEIIILLQKKSFYDRKKSFYERKKMKKNLCKQI